ncbi:MAG: hypothetical protein O2931_15520 [Planctomycetota bacterium]|nr:hypothetical protein [Planctomycetota bacterium]MDA1180191.1 hypothetical protein [Planctomycetota bacterium]
MRFFSVFLRASWVACWLGTAASAAEDLYSISAGTVHMPDVAFSRAIPVAGEEIVISACVRGTGKHPVPVRFTMTSESGVTVAIDAHPSDQHREDGTDYVARWKASQAAIYQLTVDVDPDQKSADTVRDNNRVTVVLPVVARQLHILAWASTKYMKWLTTAIVQPGQLAADRVTPEHRYWNQRGRNVLVVTHPLEREIMRLPAAEGIQRMVKEATVAAERGADGVIVDETGSYATPDGLEYIRRFGIAADEVHAKLPNKLFFNWIAGPLHRQEIEIGARNNHIMVGECYDPLHATHGPTWRARLQHYTKTLGPHNLIALGICRDVGRVYAPWIENSVRMIRELEPGMPGICYYAVDEGEFYDGNINQTLDELTWKYFIMPVVTLETSRTGHEYLNPNPLQLPAGPVKPGEATKLRVRVRNMGGVPARNVTVRFYARDTKDGKRTLISQNVIPEIGIGIRDIEEKEVAVPTERTIDGVLHPMGRFATTSRVLLEQALQEISWTPPKAGDYRIEVEIQPESQYTVLNGFAEGIVKVSSEPAPLPMPLLAVTSDDILVSQWTPVVGKPSPLEVCIHNVNDVGPSAENVPVNVYVRNLDTDERLLLQHSVIKSIGTERKYIEEPNAPSRESKVVDGVKHPISRDRSQSLIFFNRALLDIPWTPQSIGYHRIEVEIEASPHYQTRAGQSDAVRIVPVSK